MSNPATPPAPSRRSAATQLLALLLVAAALGLVAHKSRNVSATVPAGSHKDPSATAHTNLNSSQNGTHRTHGAEESADGRRIRGATAADTAQSAETLTLEQPVVAREAIPALSAEWRHAVIRDDIKGRLTWFELDYPATWYLAPDQSPSVTLSSHPGVYGQPIDGAIATLTIRRGLGDPPDQAPPGDAPAETQPVEIGGLQGTVTEFVDESGYPNEWIAVQTGDGVYYWIHGRVVGSDPQEIALREAALQRVISTVRFIPSQVDPRQWQTTIIEGDPSGPVNRYLIRHPTGWLVSQDASGLSIASPSSQPNSAGAVTIQIAPSSDDDVAGWSTAEPVPYKVLDRPARSLGQDTMEGRSRYLVQAGQDLWRVDVSLPPRDSLSEDAYWFYEQVTWAVLHTSVISYVWTPPAYP